MASMTDFRALCAELITALHDASDDVEGWGNYASSYFQEKHDLAGNIARIHAQADRASTALAQSEPQGPTDEDIYEWGNSVFLPSLSHSERLSYPVTDKDLRVIARAVLARYARPAIEPVPTAERLPGPEDCDEEGRCWWWDDDDDMWLHEHRPRLLCWTHWLPHHALPVPQQETDHG